MIDFNKINRLSMPEAALEYANGGLAVFPCSKSKRPITPRGFHDASTDPNQIAQWWEQYPNASIGTPTGGRSFVLDVGQPDGPNSLTQLETKFGSLPPTLEQQTGGNGRHLFFLMPKGNEVRNSASKIGKGIDIRGKGGYVILPPSSHDSGNKYRWTFPQALAEAPEWLISLITQPTPLPLQTGRSSPNHHKGYVGKALTEELSRIRNAQQGTRNETLNSASFAIGQLIQSGLDRGEAERALLDAATVSGLSEIEALRTIRSGLKAGEAKPRTIPNQQAKKKRAQCAEVNPEIDINPWPTPSEAIFHGLAGSFAKFATKGSEADPIAVLATHLSRFGAEVGSNPHFLAGDNQRCCINAVLVGQSSKARKGTSTVPIRKLFERTESDLIPPQFSAGPLSSGEGLVYALRDERKDWIVDKKSGSGQWIVADPGIEDKRLFVLDQEFAGALSCTKREGNTLSTIIRALFDGGKVEPLTKTNKISATNPHVCIVTHITLHELHKKLDSVEAFNGFANRFLWVCVRRPQLVPFPQALDEVELGNFRAEIFAAIRFAQQQGELQFSEQAKGLWGKIYPKLAADRPGLLGAVLNRAETYTLRLALTYALLDQSSQIDVPHLQAALAFWDYCEQSAKFIFGDTSADPTERKILTALDSCKGMDGRELHGVFSNNLRKKDMDRAISNLVVEGKITIESVKPTQGGGRPKKIFRLNEHNELNEQTTSSTIDSFCSSTPMEHAK